MTFLLIPLLAGTLQVEVLSRPRPRVVEVRQGKGWITLRAGDGLPREFHNPRLRLPGKLERSYPGWLTIETRGGRLRLVNRVSEDQYLSGVLAGETEAGSEAALEALTIAARSMIRFLRARHEGVDLCDLTHCQAYVGLAGSPAVERAIEATSGRVLLFHGEPALAPYHSTCGGATVPSPGFFSLAAAYLEGVEDQDLCRKSPHYRWQAALRPDEVSRIFGVSLPAHELLIRAATSRGREIEMSGGHRLTDEAFYRRAGRLLGWNVVKSPEFTVEREGERFLLRGRGFGHRVGLCQWGAEAMARLGKSADEILTFYFPGCTLSS